MYKGAIVEQSLTDTDILKQLNILSSVQDGSWLIHTVAVTREQIDQIAQALSVGPWYTHFWSEDKEDIFVVYKSKSFFIKTNDKSSWQPAIQFGQSIGIPPEQLDFLVD
jgi:hypothetical protein